MSIAVFLVQKKYVKAIWVAAMGDSSDDEEEIDSPHAHIPFADAFATMKPLRDVTWLP